MLVNKIILKLKYLSLARRLPTPILGVQFDTRYQYWCHSYNLFKNFIISPYRLLHIVEN
jgi:hypothetical protein